MVRIDSPLVRSIGLQVKRSRVAIALCAGVNAVVLIVPFICFSTGKVDVLALYQDPNAVAGQHFLIGSVSNAGAVMWVAGAAVCLFSGALVVSAQHASDTGLFLIVNGLISAMMGFDDLFMIHDGLAAHLFVPESVVYVVYMVLIGAWLLRFKHRIQRSDWLLLLLAGAFLFASLAFDLAPVAGTRYASSLIEEMLKLLGITFWLAYSMRTAWMACIHYTSKPVTMRPRLDGRATIRASQGPRRRPA